MGIALPQLAPASEDRVSGAQVVDGGLRFDHESNQYLTRTPSNAGDRNVWTWSAWVKKSNATEQFAMFSVYGSGSNAGYGMLWFQNDGTLYFHNWDGQNNSAQTNAKFRNNGWYHIVAVHNEANDTKMKFYVNGTLQTLAYNLTTSTGVNSAAEHRIGMEVYNTRKPYEGNMTQVYLIDGLELGPEHFGYTDPLTDTWRPKKYSFSKKSLNGGVQSWDSYFTTSGSWTDSSKLFDGTLGYGSGGETQVRDGANNNPALDVTIPVSSVGSTPQEVTIAAKMYLDSYAGANPNASTNGFVRVIATIDGTDVTKEYTDSTAPNSAGTFNGRYWQDFGSFGTGVVSRVRITTQAAWFHVAGLQVNGTVLQNDINDNTTFHLPFDGNSPIGEDRAPSPNNGTVWSSNLTGTANGSGLITEMFDGTLSSGSWANSSGYVVTFPNGGVTASNNIKLHGGSGSANWYAVINGTKTVINAPGGSSPAWSATGVSGYVDLGSGTLTSIGTEGAGIAQNGEVSGVSIDGTLLIDGQIGNSWTPVNFGGSAALDKATGARPILNTVNGGTKAAPGVFGSEVSRNYTILGTSGGGLYRFEGITETNPPLSFVRGATYIFDYSATSGSHPLAFSTTDPDSSTTSYTDGVNTATSNVTKITVPHDAPDTLYYYCTSHSNMNNAITVTTDETKADPYAWKNVLALPLVGRSADVSDKINVGSTAKAANNNNGSATASSVASNFYNGSFYFDGNDTLRYDSLSHIGTGDFTVECWYYKTSHNSYERVVSTSTGTQTDMNLGFVLGRDVSGETSFSCGGNSVSGPTISLNTWHHLAGVRDNGVLEFFVDGVSQGTVANTTNLTNTDQIYVSGNYNGSSEFLTGYIQDVRIYDGVAKYTSNFIPASTNPDILRDSPSGAAFKSQLTTITNGATAFDGSGDYLTVAGPGTLAASSNWCMECFFYCTGDASGTYRIMSANESAQSSEYILMRIRLGQYQFSTDTANSGTIDTADFDKWTHMAFTKEGTTVRGFVDGKKIWETTDNNTVTITNLITGWGYGGEYFPGFISNARFVNGSSVYTADFIPPTAPLTNITNTYLLCCQSNETPAAASVSPNISGVNDGTIWSSYLSLTDGGSWNSTYPPAQIFDGTTSAEGAGTGNILFSPPGGISYTNSVRVYNMTGGVNVAYYLNGSNVLENSGSGWKSLVSGSSGTLNTLEVDRTGGNLGTSISAIEIDGVILLDPVGVLGNSTATTFNPFNTDINTVRGQESNYCTLNPLTANTGTFSKNNLRYIGPGSWKTAGSTMSVSTGKWYYEVTLSADPSGQTSGGDYHCFGFGEPSVFGITTGPATQTKVLQMAGTGWYKNFDGTKTNSSTVCVAGDVLSIAVDLDANTFTFRHNNIPRVSGTIGGTPGRELAPIIISYNSQHDVMDFNFGQKPFKFSPPDGFQPITASTARPDTVIARPDQYFNTKPYTGNGSTQSINVGLKPDLVWIKSRSNVVDHHLYDTVRGATKAIRSNDAGNESTYSGGLTSFNNDGFSIGSYISVNQNAYTYAAWTWKAGGNAGTFNIDDVDVGSAANAKMNDGGLTSEVYNQDYVWSANYSGNNGVAPTQAFDGTGPKRDGYAHQGAELVLNFPGNGLSGRIVVYGGCGGGSADTFTLSDGHSLSAPTLYDAAPYYDVLDFGVKSNITKLTCSSGYTLYGITVDGKLLVDQGVTPPNAPSIPSTACSVGTKQGFSIIKYTADLAEVPNSIAHGLTQKPDFAIFKNIDSTLGGGEVDWGVYHSAMTGSKHLELNDVRAASTDPGAFNGTEPTSKLFYLGGKKSNSIQSHAYLTNGPANDDFIAYIWHNVPGLQKFGSYNSNGDSDGNFVELGFKPALLWIKSVVHQTSGTSWMIYTSDLYQNQYQNALMANKSAKEGVRGDGSSTGSMHQLAVDLLSNGFKLRNNGGETNEGGAGDVYLYCAWAEQPAFNLYGATSNAR